MTQEQANEIFKSQLGQQLIEIFVTSDDRAFIRMQEALLHSEGKLEPNSQPLKDTTVTRWYPED